MTEKNNFDLQNEGQGLSGGQLNHKDTKNKFQEKLRSVDNTLDIKQLGQ